MNEKFVPINLTEIKTNYEKLLANDFSIILGSPGSGKTFLARYLKNKLGKYFTVMDFMEVENNKEILNQINDLLILDGFDEYRIFEESKNHIINKFARKIRKLLKIKKIKVILTCRELDWYGDNDSNALKDILGVEVKLYFIEPIDKETLDRFLEKEKNIEKDKMYNLFKKGFIKTPQLFEIAKEILEEQIENKIDLYEKFILKSVKENNIHHKEKNRLLSDEEILEYLGYIAYFYMFSNIKKLEEEIISKIASKDFDISIINQLLTSKIFRDKTFVHRTIAEFLCGRYFAKLIENNKIDKIFIINRFRKKNFIYTELRATYAWLCAISKEPELIKIDPFYQLIYGENNHFSSKFKKQIIEEIRKYSEKNPYFLENDTYFLKDELKGFYEKELDEFLIEEFEIAIKLKNHYIYVFEMIFTSNQDKLSKKLKKFLFEKMSDQHLVVRVKEKLLQSNIFYISQKKKILEAIKGNKISDKDNTLKIALLKELNSNLSIEEIVEIFKLFNPSNMMHICSFLYEMDFKKKKELILKLEKEIFQNIRNKYDEIFKKWNCLKHFLENFYFELFHTKSADEIYAFLKKVRKFYKEYEQITSDKGYVNKNIKERNEKELQELTNKIFELYFNDLRIDKNIFSKIIEFNEWFPLARPTNISKLVINKIKNVKDEDLQKELFWIAMRYWNDKESFDEVFGKLSKELNLEEELKKFKNPPKSKYELEMEEEQKKWELEKQETIKKNNEFFKNLDKEKFLSHFGAVDFISRFVLFEKNIEEYIDIELFKEFKGYLEELVFRKDFIEYAPIEQLVKNINSSRNVDFVFYASLCLNKENENILTLDERLLKYLYILSLKEANLSESCDNEWFIKLFEKREEELAKKAIIEAINYQFNLLQELSSFLSVSSLEKLKNLFNDLLYEKNIVDSIIKVYNFELFNYLENLEKIENTELLRVFRKFLNKELLNENELVIIYINLFELIKGKERFKHLQTDIKLQLSYNFMKVFDDESKMPFYNGFQSNIDLTRSFVRDDLLNLLDENEMEQLLKKDISKYWQRLLKWKLAKKEETNKYKYFEIKELKNFIEHNGLLDERDFFEYVSLKMDELIQEIEANENNEKDFFRDGNEPKNENKCRDVFVNLFKDTKFYLIDREQNIENNRVDFEVAFKTKDWRVRVECKKDKHSELFKAVKTQLIDNYLKNKLTHFGIYLVFYFEDRKKSIDYIKEKIEENLPIEWKDKVKVKIIDLRKDSK